MLMTWIMPTVEFRSTLDAPWIDMEPLLLGAVPSGRGTPDAYVTVGLNASPVLRIDLYRSSEQSYTFNDALGWSRFAVICWGHAIYFVELDTKQVTTLELNSYFGHAYPSEKFLLVASADRLFQVNRDGDLVWRSEPLGVDGVVV